MTDGIDALADDAPNAPPAEAAVPSPAAAERETVLHALRVPVGQMLSTIPNAMALNFNDPRFALSSQELETGIDSWCTLLDVLFPDIEKLLKVFAVIAAGLWTFNVAAPRVLLARAHKRKAATGARPTQASRAGFNEQKEPKPEDTPADADLEDIGV